MPHIGTININIDTSDVVRASTAISALGVAASSTQALLNRLATINLTPTANSANTLAGALTGIAAQAARTGTTLRQMTQVQKLDVARDILNIRSFHDIQREIDLTKAAYNRLANSGTISGKELQVANQAHLASVRKLKAEMSGMSNISGGGGIGGLMSQMAGFSPTMMAAGGAIAVVGAAAIGLGTSLYNAYQPVQSLRMGLNALGQDGNSSMMSMVQTANSLGVSFLTVSKGLLQFSAATSGTSLEGEKANQIFATMAGSVKVFGGGADEVNRTMKALTQMMGKGTVSSEELRQQLGESLPGAFRLGAEAMGMSQAELSKALKDGAIDAEGFIVRLSDLMREKYGKGIKEAANTTQSELAKAGSDWAIFTANMGNNIDTAVGKVMRLLNEMRTLKDMNLPGIIEGAHESLRKGADANGLTPAQQAQTKIDAYNLTRKTRPELPEIKNTKKEILESGITNIRKLSPEEQWAEHTGSMYRSGDVGAKTAITHLDNFYINLPETLKQQEAEKKSAAWKKKNHEDEMSYAAQYRKATETNNKAELSRLEILKEQRQLQTSLKGAGDNQEKKDILTANSLQRQAEIKNKYTDKKKGGRLTTEQKQDNKFNDILYSMESSINSAEVAKETSFLDKELLKQSQIFERNEAKAKQALAAKTINNKQYQLLMEQAKAIFAEGSSYVIQTDANKKEEEAEKEKKKIREHQYQQEQNVLRIYQQQRDEITKANKEHAKRNAELDKLVKNTNRGIGRDLEAANPMSDQIANKREDYINRATDPLTNQLDGLQSKMSELNEVMGREDGATQAMIEDFYNLTESIDKTKQAIADIADTSAIAFDKMQRDSTNWQLSLSAAGNKWIQTTETAKLQADLATSTVQDFGNMLLTATGSREDWHDREKHAKKYFTSILHNISQMIIQLGVVKPLMAGLFGGEDKGGGGGAVGGLVGMAIGAFRAWTAPVEGDANFMGPINKVQANGGAWTNGIQAYANGGVFGGEHGIYSQPTFFQHSGGMGVLGEVPGESEGVLPLKRGKNGKLGVIASGGSASINHNNFSPTIVIQGNADDAAIAKMRAELAAEVKNYTRQQIATNNKQSQRPGGIAYGR